MIAPDEPFAAKPRHFRSPGDGVELAAFEVKRGSQGVAEDTHPPLLLVHGATADHTTWRAVGPMFAASRRVFAMDRRGRGASGDAAAYAIDREYEDVAAVAEGVADDVGSQTVDVAGHSYGGRCALGASLLARRIRRVVVYEGAPVPPGMTYRPDGLVDSVRGALDRGANEEALIRFLTGIVGMSHAELDAYRAHPVWPARVAAAHTILREVEAEASPAASLETLGRVGVPVLLLLGSTSRSPFRIGTEALAARLADAQVHVIDGAAHAAHHTHASEFVAAVEAFLGRAS